MTSARTEEAASAPATIELWHGSSQVVRKPEYGLGKENNDYGRGFYCTRNRELAKEWACAGLDDGYANRYALAADGLTFLDLSREPYTILNWLAMLVEHRRFQPNTPVAARGIAYLRETFLPDVANVDVIVGYRADDSYFSFARAFVNNAISLDQLSEAMRLGDLGKQTVLVSPRAFDALWFEGFEIAQASVYHVLRGERDAAAREAYRRHRADDDIDGLFMRDIIREQVTNDDPRLR